MLRFMKKAAAVILVAVMMISVSGCGEDPVIGNLSEVRKEENANEIYAVISVRDFGDITAKLFPGAAPEAVGRFTENAELGYYDGKTIHRVIPDYVIQGGSLNGDGGDGNVPDSLYIPVETSPVTFNFYGALCLAASKKGCYSQFYIVTNHIPQDIDAVITKLSGQLADEAFSARLLEEDKKKYQEYLDKLKAIPEEVKEKYKRVGGLYDLDGTSTVFGQVIDGFDVMKAISAVELVTGNRSDDKAGMPSKPIESIVIDHIEIVRIEPVETTTEETTTKAGKTKKTSDEVNAETLPTEAATSETSAAGEETDADTTVSAAAQDNADVTETGSAPDETSAEPESAESTEPVTESADPASYAAEDISVPDDDEIVVVEE